MTTEPSLRSTKKLTQAITHLRNRRRSTSFKERTIHFRWSAPTMCGGSVCTICAGIHLILTGGGTKQEMIDVWLMFENKIVVLCITKNLKIFWNFFWTISFNDSVTVPLYMGMAAQRTNNLHCMLFSSAVTLHIGLCLWIAELCSAIPWITNVEAYLPNI